MKPLILVPPAQAEALSDTQDELRAGEFSSRQPWREDETLDDLPPSAYTKTSVLKAQLWPSSANSSR